MAGWNVGGGDRMAVKAGMQRAFVVQIEGGVVGKDQVMHCVTLEGERVRHSFLYTRRGEKKKGVNEWYQLAHGQIQPTPCFCE